MICLNDHFGLNSFFLSSQTMYDLSSRIISFLLMIFLSSWLLNWFGYVPYVPSRACNPPFPHLILIYPFKSTVFLLIILFLSSPGSRSPLYPGIWMWDLYLTCVPICLLIPYTYFSTLSSPCSNISGLESASMVLGSRNLRLPTLVPTPA